MMRKIAEPVTVHQTFRSVVAQTVKTPEGGTITNYRILPGPKFYGAEPVRLLGLLYVLGVTAVLLRLVVSAFAAARIYGGGKPISHPELARLMEQMGVDGVRLRALSPEGMCQSPITLWWKGSVILVPLDFTDWPEEAQRIALLHELAHIRRNDWAVNSLAWLVSAFYWFNPLVWLALSRLRDEAERACDDEVLAIGVVATVYAEKLLQIARSLKTRNGLCFAVQMARHSQVEGRIAAILAKGRKRLRFSRKLAVQSALFTVLLALPLCAFSHFNDFQQASPPEPGPSDQIDYIRQRIESETFDVPRSLVKAIGFGAKLPDGTSVRLVGISNRSSNVPQDFWSPTGAPVRTLARPLGASEAIEPFAQEEGQDSKVFGISLSRAKEGDCTIYLADPIAKGRLHLDEDARALQHLAAGENFFLTSVVRFHEEIPDRIYAGFGQGPWRRSKAIPAVPSWTKPAPSMPAVRFVQGRLEALIGSQTLVLSSEAPTEGEVRVRFLDANGVSVATSPPQLAFERIHNFETANVQAIKKIVIEHRPVAWVNFSGIATRPTFAMAPTLHWGTSTQGEAFHLGSIHGELQGTVQYQLVHSLWHPSAFLTPSGKAWAHYPSPRDAVLEQQPESGLVPHTVMLQFQEQVSFNDHSNIKVDVQVQDGKDSNWEPAQYVNEKGSDVESLNNIHTRQVKRLTFYSSSSHSRVRFTLRASDLPWITTNRMSLDLSGVGNDGAVEITGNDHSSAVKIGLPGPKGPRSLPAVGALSSPNEDVRVVLVTRSGGTICPSGASVSDNGDRGLAFNINSQNPTSGQMRKPSDVVAVEFQSRHFDLNKTLDIGTPR
jgi:beta-lactamase regulating signal transducer with metallopeptidase domain